jgi:biotin transport system substrate-specific component
MSHPSSPLRTQVLPRETSQAMRIAADVLLVSAGMLLVALAAQISIHIPGTPVPGTLQTGAALLVGASLGSLRGFLSLALYLLAGTSLPIFAGGSSGWDSLHWGEAAGARGGYLVGMLIAAALVGALAEQGWDRRVPRALLMLTAGDAVVFLVGVPWLHAATNLSWWDAIDKGFLWFVPIEAAKFCIVAGLLPGAWAVVRRVRSDL